VLIHNANIITWGKTNQILRNHAVLIKDGLIVEIGASLAMLAAHPEGERLDAGDQWLMPGNICAHTHFYGAYARGLAIPAPAPADFPQILQRLWWPLDKALDVDSVRYSALVHLVDAIKHGTTTLVDHHASPNFIDGSLDVIAEAVQASGLRAALCYEVTDRDGDAKAKAGIRENVRFLQRLVAEKPGRLGALFGLHASLTLSDATLDASRAALPDGAGFHIHVAEHEADEDDSLAKSGLRVVSRLLQHGILNPHSLVAHAVHINAAEMMELADSGAWVTHQPRSNMNNGVGAADIEGLLAAGVRVCLGNDGFTQDMWTEWKAAYLMHKLAHRDPRKMNGADVVSMAVGNNAALANQLFPGAALGEISMGARADLILVDAHPFTPLTDGNAPWHILFGFNESMITTTIVDGKVLMKDRKLQTLDEEEIAAKAMELAPAVWVRYAKFAEAAQ
jgi:putative selenium metabolism protein SsnA